MLASIAAERIREEFNGILLSKNPFRGLELLRKTGVLSLILPELMQGFGVNQNKFHKYDVYYHILHTIQSVEPLETEELTLLVRLAALFHDIAKPMVQKKISKQDDPVYYNHEVVGANIAKKIMKRLKYSNSEIDFVTLLVRQHMFYYQDEWKILRLRHGSAPTTSTISLCGMQAMGTSEPVIFPWCTQIWSGQSASMTEIAPCSTWTIL